MDFPGNMILEDDTVMLRPLQLADTEYLLPYALNEPEIWTYSSISPLGEKGMEKYIQQTIAQRELQKEYPFIVFDKRLNAFAGSTRFYDIQPANLTARLGYTWYGKNFRRTGLNRHCKLLMLTYAFETWGMERIEFRADARNKSSITAMLAIGCTVEGILRSNAVTPSGERRDSIILSILKTEWLEKVKQDLLQKTQG